MKYIKILFFIGILTSFVACTNKKYDYPDGVYANIVTDKGDILLKLYYEDTPLTVANFISLAEGTSDKVVDSLKGKKFYNGLTFHRVIKDFMIQGGDIKGTGAGDPGYKFADEFPKNEQGDLKYKHDKKGVLSMANSGPGTNGSQFFITHKPTPWLNGRHTIFGEVSEGLNIVDSIQQGDIMKTVEIIRIGDAAESFNAKKAFLEALKSKEEQELLKEEKNRKDSIAFSEKMNEAKALELASGLKYLELKKGNGKVVMNGDKVKVHYTGYLSNGEVFDTSKKRNRTFDFVVGVDRVIEGWTEGIQLIEEGGSARLFIPYQLAYGPNGYGPIPPKARLIFDVEVVKIDK